MHFTRHDRRPNNELLNPTKIKVFVILIMPCQIVISNEPLNTYTNVCHQDLKRTGSAGKDISCKMLKQDSKSPSVPEIQLHGLPSQHGDLQNHITKAICTDYLHATKTVSLVCTHLNAFSMVIPNIVFYFIFNLTFLKIIVNLWICRLLTSTAW